MHEMSATASKLDTFLLRLKRRTEEAICRIAKTLRIEMPRNIKFKQREPNWAI